MWEELSDLHTPITGKGQYNPQTGTETIVVTPSQRVPLDCKTELETDARGIVTHARSVGLACLAPTPTRAAGTGPATVVAPVVPTAASVTAPTVEEPAIADEGAGMGDEPDAPADKRAERRARRAERATLRRDRRPE